ncbi:RNA polymerase subunit sigma-24 [Pseudohongiella nitratireducens]|uniref:RNA polymerase subunit sigma-24 n=1 Tax=Pseudohongiella nitratireducens TaxID=1768907 RepID=A0A917GRK0_9GAMM|nr:RNA polymerase sigma factor [Pseudohongiella nitratireducens]GGG55273.1 RNA polymerase subunit sigma-24 [Pseudohongiella nitratireducens]
MERTELALIQRAIQGQPDAWQALVRTHETRVYNFGLRMTGSVDDAQDLLQEVFFSAYQNLSGFRQDAQFSTWLMRIAYNRAVDQARRRKVRDADPLPTSTETVDDRPGPAAETQSQQRNQQLQSWLAALPLEQRMVIELKFFQEMTFDDIASLESISPNTAKTRFYAGLARLKTLMGDCDGLF